MKRYLPIFIILSIHLVMNMIINANIEFKVAKTTDVGGGGGTPNDYCTGITLRA